MIMAVSSSKFHPKSDVGLQGNLSVIFVCARLYSIVEVNMAEKI